MLLQTGDALVFGGGSRLRYHGVPRVWTGEFHLAPPADAEGDPALPFGVATLEVEDSKASEEQLMSYLRQVRVNINVRQVFPPLLEDKSHS